LLPKKELEITGLKDAKALFHKHNLSDMSKVTLVLLNARIYTLNPKQPTSKAIAVKNGRIKAVGTNKEIRKYINEKTKVIDAKNKTIVPGLVDCHVHMTSLGKHLQTLDLRNIESVKEMQQKLTEYAKKNPQSRWILGGRWSQDKFAEKRHPTRWDLDAAVADKPVFLIRVCGHMGVANSKALHLAGITKETKVDSGAIGLDTTTGKPNGILRENALDLVWRAIPKPSLKELQETCMLACKKAVEAGLTGVHWLVGSAKEIHVIQKLYSQGKLPLRVYLGIPVDFLDELTNLGLLTGFGNNMVKIGFVKILADGSFGAHTAALKKPYFDKPKTKGIMLYTQKRLNKFILKAHKAGLQLAVHAIGDHTIDTVLNTYEKALKKHPRENHRHRIEHCSLLDVKLIKRMKQLGLIASVQPHFIVSDFWIVDRLGKDRARWVHPFKTLINEGLIVVSGSDCPVEPINPLLGIWAAVARKDSAEEKLTVEEALKTYTSKAAYASFDENNKGTIEAGKFADLTVLSKDICKIPPDMIKRTKAEMTIVDGQIVYARTQ